MLASHRPAGVLSCHCWNANGTELALCPDNSTLQIYAAPSEGALELRHTLPLHDGLISGIDWSHRTGKIATCSHDCHAHVLAFSDGRWEPELVVTRLKRAALCVRWSPCGQKFALGSAGREAAVCYTEDDPKWWGAALLRKHESAVMDVAWHPDGDKLATASADGLCRVFSAEPRGRRPAGQQGKAAGAFGEVLLEIDLDAGYAVSVAWSPSGTNIAVSCHDSKFFIIEAIRIADNSTSVPPPQCIKAAEMPFLGLAFLSDNLIIAAGFDAEPIMLFKQQGHSWSVFTIQAERSAIERQPLCERQLSSDFSARLALFSSAPSKKATAGKEKAHENTIIEVCRLPDDCFSTAGLDGRVVVWRRPA